MVKYTSADMTWQFTLFLQIRIDKNSDGSGDETGEHV